MLKNVLFLTVSILSTQSISYAADKEKLGDELGSNPQSIVPPSALQETLSQELPITQTVDLVLPQLTGAQEEPISSNTPLFVPVVETVMPVETQPVTEEKKELVVPVETQVMPTEVTTDLVAPVETQLITEEKKELVVPVDTQVMPTEVTTNPVTQSETQVILTDPVASTSSEVATEVITDPITHVESPVTIEENIEKKTVPVNSQVIPQATIPEILTNPVIPVTTNVTTNPVGVFCKLCQFC